MNNLTAAEIEERYKNIKPMVDPLAEIAIDRLTKLMEELAGAPKEEMGKRQPGEKCMYELQRIENRKQLVQDMAKSNSPYYDP